MSNKYFLTFVLSPVMDTIERAKKTRELWAASFVFSRWMYHLLDQAQKSLPCEAIVSPAFDATRKHAYGAGLYHDRGFLKLTREPRAEEMKTWLDTALEALLKDLNLQGKPAEKENLRSQLQVQIALYPENADDSLPPPLLDMNRLLDNLELRPHYQPVEEGDTLVDMLDRGIHALYGVGYEVGKSSIFISMPDGAPRLPSIPEIALRELRDRADQKVRNTYRNIVEQPTNFRVSMLKRLGGRGKDLPKAMRDAMQKNKVSWSDMERFEDSQRMNELIYDYLRTELSDTLKFRHHYFAVVQLDGDGLGKHIASLQAEGGSFPDFSRRLMTYAQEAAEKVIEYGGTPIFSGGDDLLFLAPVAVERTSEKNQTATNVLSLCKELDTLFKDTMQTETLSLSGGVFVSYYKFPLGEAVAEAGRLEKQGAKKFKIWTREALNQSDDALRKPKHQKNALTFAVRKHSGQTFGTTLHMGSKTFPLLNNLLRFETDLDNTFLTAAMHRLQSMPTLLADVAKSDDEARRKAFKDHQFGKGGPKHEGQFLTDTLEYAHELFSHYGDVLDPDQEAKVRERTQNDRRTVDPFDYATVERLFAVLRFKQFLIQADHD